jgi:superfamily II DNA or RNA helicase
MISLPTGAGKTRVAVQAVTNAVLKSQNRSPWVLWLAQKDELCEQAVQCFREVWSNIGLEATPLEVDRMWGTNPVPATPEPNQPTVVVSTIQKLNSQLKTGGEVDWLKDVGALVIDEAHHSVAPTYRRALGWLEDPDGEDHCPVIGLSATPFRGTSEEEGRRLKRLFDSNLIPPDEQQATLWTDLRDRQFLAQPTHHLLDSEFHLEFNADERRQLEVHKLMQFPASASKRLAENQTRNNLIVEAVFKRAARESVLLFANTKEHAQLLAGLLQIAGVRAAAVIGETRSGVRQHFIDQFKKGEIRVLCNFGVLTTGFDAPQVDTVFIARTTFSPLLYQQMIGRGLRGPLNRGKATCDIVTVKDNLVMYGDKLAYHYFEDLWRK